MRPQNGTPRATSISRPLLPFDHLNPYVKDSQYTRVVCLIGVHRLTTTFLSSLVVDQAKIPPVKFQEIVRDGQSTIVSIFYIIQAHMR